MLDFFKIKRDTPLPFKSETLITESTYVVIDTELTGLNLRKDEIISIGAVKMFGQRIDLGDTFHRLIKPSTAFNPESVIVHGITPSDVREAESIDTILSEFIDFCDDNILLGHCILIDINFINREMKRVLGIELRNAAIDTFHVYEWLRHRQSEDRCFASPPKDASLNEIAHCFGISVRRAHDALMDAFITAQLFQRFIPLLGRFGVVSVGDLCRLGNPKGGDLFRKSGEIANF